MNTVARRLDCSTRTVYRLIEMGKLEAVKKTPRNTRISAESFENYVEQLKYQDY